MYRDYNFLIEKLTDVDSVFLFLCSWKISIVRLSPLAGFWAALALTHPACRLQWRLGLSG